MARGVAHHGRLGRLQVLAEPAAAVEPRPDAAHAARRASGAADTTIDLLDAEVDELLQHAREARRPIADAMRLAAPVGVGREASAAAARRRAARSARRRRRRPDSRARRRRDRRPRPAAPRPRRSSAGEPARAGAARPPARTIRSRRASRSWTTSTSSRNPGWPRFSPTQLHVAPAQLGRRRLLELRRAAHQIPHRAPGDARSPRPTTAARARPPPERPAHAPADRADPAGREPTSAATGGAEHQHGEPRQPGRQRLRARNAACARPQVGRRASPGAPRRTPAWPMPTILATKSIGIDDQPERDRRRAGRRRWRAPAAKAPADHPEHAAPGIEAPHRRRPPEALLVPQPLRPVDRGEQRADDADAVAADDVDLDARFVQRAQHAGVIGAGRAGAGQDQCGAKLRRVGFGERGRDGEVRRRRT